MKKTPSSRTYWQLLFIILLIAFAIRLIGINQIFNEDELHWAYSVSVRDWFGMVMRNAPLSIYALTLFTAVFGVHAWSIRLLFILIGLLTILVTVQLAKEQYGYKTALITAVLLSIHPLHILASLQAAYEGSFLTLFFITTLYLFFRHTQKRNRLSLLLAGLSFGLAFLSKTSAILLIPPIIFIYNLITTKNILISLRDTSIIFVIGIFIFFIGFVTPSILTQSPAAINAFTQLTTQTSLTRTSLFPLIFQYGSALIWLGPLFIFLPILAALRKKVDALHATSIIYIVLFYLLAIRESSPPIERYWMILLPSLAILSARGIMNTFTKKNVRYVLLITSISFFIVIGLLVFVNLLPSTILPFYPKEAYLHNVLSLQLNFLVPITGSSGPLGFYVNFFSIIIVFTVFFITFILDVCSLFSRRKNMRITLFVVCISLGAGIAYQLFFTQEYLLALTHPHIVSITTQTIDYVNNHPLQTPIYYFKNYALFYYFNDRYKKHPHHETIPSFDYFDSAEYTLNHLKNLREQILLQPFYDDIIPLSFVDDTDLKSDLLLHTLQTSGGSVILIDFPLLSKQGPLWRVLTRCRTVQTFADKHKTLAYIFDCSGLKK